MACENIKNAFYALTGQVSPRLYNKISINDPWVAYVEKGEWPTGMGYTISSMMLERTLTDSEQGSEWVNATPSGSGDVATTNNNCLPTPELLSVRSDADSLHDAAQKYPDGELLHQRLAKRFHDRAGLGQRDGSAGDRDRMDLEQPVPERVSTGSVRSRDRRDWLVHWWRGCRDDLWTWSTWVTRQVPASPPTSRLVQGTLEQIYSAARS